MVDQIKRLLVPLAWSGLGVCLLALLLRTSTAPVLAELTDGLPSEQAAGSLALSVSDWQTLMLDAFDGTFADMHQIQRTITSTGSTDYSWGRVVSSSQGFTDTIWSVQGGQGVSLTAGIDVYTGGVTTTVTYGPISLRDALTVEIQFAQWISAASGDGLEWGWSTDGGVFTFLPVVPVSASTWETTTESSETSEGLGSLLGERSVFLAFRFRSDDDDQVGLGAFLDDVSVRAKYETAQYLPFVSRNYYRPYSDDFSDPSSGWPKWKVRAKNPDGSVGLEHRGGYVMEDDRWWASSLYLQQEALRGAYEEVLDDGRRVFHEPIELADLLATSVTPAGVGEEMYYIWVRDDGDHVFISSPELAPDNFVYQVKARYTYMEPKRWGNEYGIAVLPEPVNPKDRRTFKGYTFQVQFNPIKSSGGGVDSCQNNKTVMKRWDRVDGQKEVKKLLPYDDSLKNKISCKPWEWNTLRLERHGNTFKAYVNGHLAGVATDGRFTGSLYVGFFVAHEPEYSYNMTIEYDDVQVTYNPQP